MRTGCSLTVCRSLVPGGGSPWQGGLSLAGGLLGRGVSPWRGGLLGRGVSPWQGVLLGRGVSPWRGGSPWQGGGLLGRGVSQHALRQTPPPVDRITDTSKNITLATTSLRPVNITIRLIEVYTCVFFLL